MSALTQMYKSQTASCFQANERGEGDRGDRQCVPDDWCQMVSDDWCRALQGSDDWCRGVQGSGLRDASPFCGLVVTEMHDTVGTRLQRRELRDRVLGASLAG